MINSRISISNDITHAGGVNGTYIVQQQISSSAFQIYELSYFLNVASAITFLGALLPVHNSNWT